MAANNTQVQAFVDSQIRPLCELLRSTVEKINNTIASIDDVYANLTNSPTWADTNTGNLPHAMVPSDVLAINELIHTTLTAITGDANYAVAQKCCRTF